MTAILEKKIHQLNKELDQLKSEYFIKRIGFFGSITREDFTEKSDIDIIVELSEPIGFFKFLQLERALTKLLGYKVDLVTSAAIKPAIRTSVINDTVYV